MYALVLGLSDFPVSNLISNISILNSVPDLDPRVFMARFYPYNLFLPTEGQKSVEDTLQTFNISKVKTAGMSVESVSHNSSDPHSVNVQGSEF